MTDLLEVYDRIDALAEECHALALAMVSLEHQIDHAQDLGRRTLELQLIQRREIDQWLRSELLEELIIERQVRSGQISRRSASSRHHAVPARLDPGRLPALPRGLAPAHLRPHHRLPEVRRQHP